MTEELKRDIDKSRMLRVTEEPERAIDKSRINFCCPISGRGIIGRSLDELGTN